MTDVFFNGILIGELEGEPKKFVEDIKQARRDGRISNKFRMFYGQKMNVGSSEEKGRE